MKRTELNDALLFWPVIIYSNHHRAPSSKYSQLTVIPARCGAREPETPDENLNLELSPSLNTCNTKQQSGRSFKASTAHRHSGQVRSTRAGISWRKFISWIVALAKVHCVPVTHPLPDLLRRYLCDGQAPTADVGWDDNDRAASTQSIGFWSHYSGHSTLNRSALPFGRNVIMQRQLIPKSISPAVWPTSI